MYLVVYTHAPQMPTVDSRAHPRGLTPAPHMPTVDNITQSSGHTHALGGGVVRAVTRGGPDHGKERDVVAGGVGEELERAIRQPVGEVICNRIRKPHHAVSKMCCVREKA